MLCCSFVLIGRFVLFYASPAFTTKSSPINSVPVSPTTVSNISFSSTNTEDSLMGRRSSTGMTSPQTDCGTAPTADQEQDGFYLLKKDSQRRATLVRVISQDQIKICEIWIAKLRQDMGDTVLTTEHLFTLMKALREYIPEQNKQFIQEALHTLKEELEFDGTAINQIQLALYLFQEAVNIVLRHHNIKPHWMFALDNLVRHAVHAAITVLSPELGANLAGREHRGTGGEEGSPSVGSTINSVKSLNPMGEESRNSKLVQDLLETHENLKLENLRLLQELVDVQKAYHDLLKHTYSEKKLQVQLLAQSVQNPVLNGRIRLDPTFGITGAEGLSNTSFISQHVKDKELVHWLENLSIDQESIDKITCEDYTLSDTLQFMTREDLRRLGLSGGVELRIWRALMEYRHKSGVRAEGVPLFDRYNGTLNK